MKNDYEIRGDVTAIFLDRKDGTRLECLIDTADLPRVMEFPNKWSPHWDRHTKSFYAEGKTYNGRNGNGHNKREYISLHRWIMQPPDGHEVDHINHDTLNNRRCNLRIVPKGANQQNYHKARVTSRSGIRGVTWSKKNKKWIARFRVNGKTYHIGSFNTIDEAKVAVSAARAKYMPYSLDANNKAIPNLNDIINPCFETGMYSTNKTGYRGLVYEKRIKKWFGRAQRKGIVIKTGYYENEEDAYRELCEKLKTMEAI